MCAIIIIGICDTCTFGNLSEILVSENAVSWLVYYHRGTLKIWRNLIIPLKKNH